MRIRWAWLALVIAVPPWRAAAAATSTQARSWEAWPAWELVETGSIDFRTRIDGAWGGLAVLTDPPLRGYDDANHAADVAEHLRDTAAEAADAIDRGRPMRELVRPRAGQDGVQDIAFLFVVAARARAPDQCQYVERSSTELALVCGAEGPAAALRDDFLARGAPALEARALHGELARDRAEPARASLDASEDDAGLHLHEVATPRTPAPAVTISAGALAAALRLAAWPVDVTAVVIDDGTSKVDGARFFLDRPIARVFRDTMDQMRRQARDSGPDTGTTFRFAVEAPPSRLPRGTRVVRTRGTTTSSGVVMTCTPEQQRVMGSCTKHHVPRQTEVDTDVIVLVPGDGGTWELEANELDAATLRAIRGFFATPALAAPPPLPWQPTARALGVVHVATSHALLWWARTPGTGTDEQLDVEGRTVAPATPTP